MTDPSKLPAEAAAISAASPKIRAYAIDAAASIVAHESELDSHATEIAALMARVAKLEEAVAGPVPTPPPPTPTPTPAPAPTGALVEFGNFGKGDLSEFADITCHPERMKVISGGPNGGNYARFTGDSSCLCYGDPKNVRVNAIGFPHPPAWFTAGHELWRAISMRVPKGSTVAGYYNGDEIHGGPSSVAPYHLTPGDGGWYANAIGSDAAGYAKDAFAEYGFGPAQNMSGGGTLYGGAHYRQHADWAGGNWPVVPDQWVHFRVGMLYTGTGATDAWFELHARRDGDTAWTTVVPRKTGIVVGYPLSTMAPYPIVGLYLPVQAGTFLLDFAAGAWSNDQATLAAWQDTRLGVA